MNFVPAGTVVPRVGTPLDRVWRLQGVLSSMPQVEPETEHHFADGMYCRTIKTPADVTVVGKVHKREHLYVVVSGTVRVTQGDGEPVEVTGPCVVVGKPGTKRAVYSVTDSVRLTVHRTDQTDLAEIEAELLEADPTALFGPANQLLRIAK